MLTATCLPASIQALCSACVLQGHAADIPDLCLQTQFQLQAQRMQAQLQAQLRQQQMAMQRQLQQAQQQAQQAQQQAQAAQAVRQLHGSPGRTCMLRTQALVLVKALATDALFPPAQALSVTAPHCRA